MNQLRDIRYYFGWSVKALADKANVPKSAISKLENNLKVRRDYTLSIVEAIENDVDIIINSDKQSERVISVHTKDEKKEDKINLKTYFPNLSSADVKRLFKEEWLQENVKGYGKRSTRFKEELISYSDVSVRFEKILRKLNLNKKKSTNRENILKNINPEANEGRLGRVLSYTKELTKSLSERERQKYYKDNFHPHYNPKACKWFQEFDIVNNTQGIYATNKGECFVKELGYFLDYINHDIKLIMEWDEEHHYDHLDRLSETDVLRQKRIEEHFPDYQFIRLREKDLKEY